MKLDDILSKKKVKKNACRRKIVANFDTGDYDDMKEREMKIKLQEKEDKLNEIRKEKKLRTLAEIAKKQKQQIDQENRVKIYQIWQKINYLLQVTMKPDAYKYFNDFRQTNPKLYKALLRCLVEPQVVQNIDAYIDRIRTHGAPKQLINLRTVVWYAKKLMGEKAIGKIEVQHKGEERRSLH